MRIHEDLSFRNTTSFKMNEKMNSFRMQARKTAFEYLWLIILLMNILFLNLMINEYMNIWILFRKYKVNHNGKKSSTPCILIISAFMSSSYSSLPINPVVDRWSIDSFSNIGSIIIIEIR